MAKLSDGLTVLEVSTIPVNGTETIEDNIKYVTHELVNTQANIHEVIGKVQPNHIVREFDIVFIVPYSNPSDNLGITSILASNSEYNDLTAMLKSGKQLKFTSDLYGVDMYVNLMSYREEIYKQGCKIYVRFTTARQPGTTDFLYPIIEKENKISKPSLFDKIKKGFKKVCDFKDKANDKIAVATGYCNSIGSTISLVGQQLSMTSSMINSAFDGLDVIADSISNCVSEIGNLITSIKNIPSNFESHFEKLTNAISSISNIFASESSNDTNSVNSFFLLDVADGISSLQTEGVVEVNKIASDGTPYVTYITTAGNTVNSINARNNILFLQLMFYMGIIINIYEKIQNINQLNIVELTKLESKIVSLYKKIINHPLITNEMLIEIQKAHVVYQDNMNILKVNATKVVEINVTTPTPLICLVSNLNNYNNLDFLEETIALNNLTNIFTVSGKVNILVNE
jgi:hypothetical protein